MRSIGELFSLFFASKWFFLKEERRVARLYFSHPQFEKCDRALRSAYRLHNPYRISKNFLKQKNSTAVHLYGETPLTTVQKIVEECALTSSDHLFELGAGRGRSSFFLSHFLKCRVTAIEWIPEFVAKAQSIQNLHSCPRLEFIYRDFTSMSFTGATVIYLYGTCLEDQVIDKLIAQFKKLPVGTKIITVSYPLSDYDAAFFVRKQFQAAYPWGETDIYLNERLP